MRVLVLASKCPWPPVDGGRLALWQTILALQASGVTVHLIAPYSADEASDVPAWQQQMAGVLSADLSRSDPRPWARATLSAWRSGTAVSLARHAHPALATALPELIASWQPDLIHAECLQSLAMLGPAPWPKPVVLRLQNVESDLWQQWPSPLLLRPLMWSEAARLRRDERLLMHAAALSLAITDYDATRLQHLAGAGIAARVMAWTVPFPSELPAADTDSEAPEVVLPGSRGWGPNQQAFDWTVQHLAPALQRLAPSLRLTVFTQSRDPRWPSNIQAVPVPAESINLFPRHAIAALPLFAGSGIRMRILEAWARGLPVVATSVAARGLKVESGQGLLIADDPKSFATALQRVQADPSLRQRLVDAGRSYLREHHDPGKLGQQLLAHYQGVLERSR